MSKKSEMRKREKAYLKKLEMEEKELEKEIKEELKKEEEPKEKFSIIDFFSLFSFNDEDDEEYLSYLTEEELDNLHKEQEEKKKFNIRISIILFVIMIIAVIGTNFIYNYLKSDLLKITEPLMKEYYKTNYNDNIKFTNIENLTYINEDKNEVISDIALATTPDNHHIMAVNNNLLGDDISISKVTNEALEYFHTNLTSTNIITDNVTLSYQDYYLNYNRYCEYIKVLPHNMSFNDLLNTNKLTVTYTLVYQYDFDFNILTTLYNNFSTDSKFVLIKHESGLPVLLTIIDNTGLNSYEVIHETEREKGITVIDLSTTNNKVANVYITKIGKGSLKALDSNYYLNNGLSITYKKARNIKGVKEDNRTSYYLIRFKSDVLNPISFVQLNKSKRDDKYPELDKNSYKDILFIEVGGFTYLIGDEEVMLASIHKNTSFLCNIGLC